MARLLCVKFRNNLRNLIRLPPSKDFNSCKTEMRYGYTIERMARLREERVGMADMHASISSLFSSITADGGRPRRALKTLPVFSNLSVKRLIELLFGVSASGYSSQKQSIQASVGIRFSSQNDIESTVKQGTVISSDIRFKYPEFLPHPYMKWRNSIREKLERSDMLKRRSNIVIPEFYVGSILAVTSSNVHAVTRTTKFVGICIRRQGSGLNSSFLLRNVVDNQGVEILYELYDPKIQKIDVLRLEKRLDNDLMYLRDAEPQYSTFPFDMEPEYLSKEEEVPINPIKVKLKPRPWRKRYELDDYKGIEPFDHLLSWRVIRRKPRALKHKRPVQYDLMWHYRNTIPEEEQREIYTEVCSELQKQEIRGQKIKRKSEFVSPEKAT
ncbi:hypothetical protein PGB90_003308 [Kerria lacca]